MNLLLIRPSELTGSSSATITGERFLSVQEDHKLSPGVSVKAGLLGGKIGTASVARIGEQAIELNFTLTEEPPPKLPFTLIVAVSRPQTIKKVLWLAGSCGLSNLCFVGSEQSQKSYLSSKALLPENLNRELFRGLEQGCDTFPPAVTICPTVASLLEQYRPKGVRLLAALARAGESVPLASSLMSGYDEVTLAIGPESGWSEREERQFRSAGYECVGLGPRVLRVEFAAAVAFGQYLAVSRGTG